ncbi:FtsW/RodA/SpoVE family cell cycle protein, partial [Georgenia sp. 10Sc9-8]|nr:FtsW/RodA/SpoVE family cell cycle protein [Georgenia halotolerans]
MSSLGVRRRPASTATAPRRENAALSYYLVVGATLLLLAIGVVMVLSASTIESMRDHDGNPYAAFVSQAQYVLIGLPLMVVASRVPVAWYRRLAWPALGLGMALQMLVF